MWPGCVGWVLAGLMLVASLLLKLLGGSRG